MLNTLNISVAFSNSSELLFLKFILRMDHDNTTLDFVSLNPKQRLKEFKSTQKDLKSKDLEIKLKALEKIIVNPVYFIEGNCFVPFVASIIPKKVKNFYITINVYYSKML